MIITKKYNIEADANLSGADLRHVNLTGADLSRADLRGADLYGAEGLEPE